MDAATRRDARLSWMAARYNAFAFHDPKSMPDDPSVKKVHSAERQEADAIAAREVLMAWAKRSATNG